MRILKIISLLMGFWHSFFTTIPRAFFDVGANISVVRSNGYREIGCLSLLLIPTWRLFLTYCNDVPRSVLDADSSSSRIYLSGALSMQRNWQFIVFIEDSWEEIFEYFEFLNMVCHGEVLWTITNKDWVSKRLSLTQVCDESIQLHSSLAHSFAAMYSMNL